MPHPPYTHSEQPNTNAKGRAFHLPCSTIAPWSVIVAALAILTLSVPTASAFERSFGWNGLGGSTGRTGQLGATGKSVEIFANGNLQEFSLPGLDGGTAGDGGRGRSGFCRSQPSGVRHDLRAAHGGNGGAGGNGGNGGAGGESTIYYTNPADLADILINAPGGEGGAPGQGAPGGNPCQCELYSWQVQTCSGADSCRDEEFFCRDGQPGGFGEEGHFGLDGRAGAIKIVAKGSRLSPDQPFLSVRLNALKDSPYHLSKHIWDARTGANNILHPSSDVADNYQEYRTTVHGSYEVSWEAVTPISRFASATTTMEIKPDGSTSLVFSDLAWIEGYEEQEGTAKTFYVLDAVHASDVTSLVSGGLLGTGSGLQLIIIDPKNVSDIVTTTYSLRMEAKDRFSRRGKKVFDGVIPEELIEKTGFNRYILNLGKLKLKGGRIRGGTEIKLKLSIKRSFAGRSKTQTLNLSKKL